MKRIVAIALCLWLFSATFAFAIPSPGPTVHYVGGWWWQPIRVLAQWFVGPKSQATGDNYTKNPDGTCTKTFYLIQYYYDGSVKITYGQPQTVACP